MIKEFLKITKKEFPWGGTENEGKVFDLMDQPELSLGGSSLTLLLNESANCSSNSESDANTRRKRKQTCDEQYMVQTGIDLQLNDPLPLDWEQCLDLLSGRMYYLNRKTLKKSWMRPKEQKLDLELNISTLASSEEKANSTSTIPEEPLKKYISTGNMVAVVCINCHLLVMLCKSSPSCPNCKYMNSVLPPPATNSSNLETIKPLKTLSLLH